MKKGDIILIIILLIAGITGCVVFFMTRDNASYVAVSVDGETQGIYSLARDRELVIETDDGGENILVIQGGSVDMTWANCPNQDCVNHKPISAHNESIVCLPHRLVVMIYNQNSAGETDATVY